LIPAKDHLLDAYLPGVVCRTASGVPLTLSCRESDDPWPLVAGSLNGGPTSAPMSAFFSTSRNFFTGVLAPGVGKFTTVPKFYSAASVLRDKNALWLFASVDGSLHRIDGVTDQSSRLAWGSDMASVKTSCGAGWQVLVTTSSDQNGSDQNTSAIRAHEFPDRDPVPVSASVDFRGDVTALWTEAKGDSAIAVIRNPESGSYEAFRLAITCNQ
jgi:hypothetical protein